MTTATLPRQSWDTWPCYSPAALRKALEEYTEYDMAEGAPGSGEYSEDRPDREGRIYAQNCTIDKAMILVGAASPYAWSLLDGYFRRGNFSQVRKGWIAVAEALSGKGLDAPKCPGPFRCADGDDRFSRKLCPKSEQCRAQRATFEEHLELCVEALFEAVQRRNQRVEG